MKETICFLLSSIICLRCSVVSCSVPFFKIMLEIFNGSEVSNAFVSLSSEALSPLKKELDENIEEHVEFKTDAQKKPKTSFFKRFKPELSKKFVQQPRRIGAPMPKKWDRLKRFFIECKRVLRVTKKPDKMEFKTIVKVSALGMAIIGVIGFIITLAKELLFK